MANLAETLDHNARRKSGKPTLQSIEIKPAENGGHVVTHHMSEGGPEYHPPAQHVFGEGQGKEMLEHVAEHLKVHLAPASGQSKRKDSDDAEAHANANPAAE